MKNLLKNIARIACLSGAIIINSGCNKNPTFQRDEYYMLGSFDKWERAIKLRVEGSYRDKSLEELQRKGIEFPRTLTNEEANRHFQTFGDRVYFCDNHLP